MTSPRLALNFPQRLGKLELGQTLSDSFFGVRQRAHVATTGASGTYALGTATHEDAAFGAQPLQAVRVVCAESTEVIESLALAASAVRRANHPAVLSPLSIVLERGRLGVVTSDEGGVTLAALGERAALRGEALPPAIVHRIALDVLAGLHALEGSVDAAERSACLQERAAFLARQEPAARTSSSGEREDDTARVLLDAAQYPPGREDDTAEVQLEVQQLMAASESAEPPGLEVERDITIEPKPGPASGT